MGGDTYKINESGSGASGSLLFRFLRLHLLLSALAFPLFYFKLGIDNYPVALGGVSIFALLIFVVKKEASSIRFENGRINIKGKRFLFVTFRSSADCSKVKYKFNKPNDRKKPALLRKTPKLVLYKDGTKWVEFTGDAFGWKKAKLAETVKTLIAKGCYNWFEFNKKSRRKKKS